MGAVKWVLRRKGEKGFSGGLYPPTGEKPGRLERVIGPALGVPEVMFESQREREDKNESNFNERLAGTRR